MLFLIFNQIMKVLTVQCALLNLMKFLQISGHLMNPRENAYDVLILLQQFQLLAILGQIRILQAMLVRLVFSQLLCEAHFEILE